jgi:GNAT superfamily N-acetyltransferase
MPLSVHIREAQDNDLSSIAALLVEMGHAVDTETVRANLRAVQGLAPLFGTFVAVRGQAVVGIVSVFASPVLHRPDPVGRVSILTVDQSCLGQGIGSALLLHAETFLRGLGCGRIEITSAPHRLQAHEFYRRRGYTQQGVRFLLDFSEEDPV